MAEDYLFAQGQAKLATPEDLEKDAIGVTKPNLHRRIDPDRVISLGDYYLVMDEDEYPIADRDALMLIRSLAENAQSINYTLLVKSVNSYRNTEYILHDEDSNDSEIP